MIGKLDLYKVFLEVAEFKSFSRAAKALYMTQPAVSQAVASLEQELEIRLFTRTSKGVILTNEGQLLYEHVSSAIGLISIGEKKLKEVKNLMVGDLQIGVGDTVSKYFLLKYLEEFHRNYPGVRFKIFNRTTSDLCTMLKSGEIDIAICNLPINENSFEIKKCLDISDVFVCGEKYKSLIGDKPLSFEELSQLPLIFLEPISNSRKYVEKFMMTRGVKINPEIELGSHELLLEFAKINLGVSCVIREFSQDYLDSDILYEIKLKEEIPSRSIGICFLKSVSLSPASAKFVEILSGEDK